MLLIKFIIKIVIVICVNIWLFFFIKILFVRNWISKGDVNVNNLMMILINNIFVKIFLYGIIFFKKWFSLLILLLGWL